MPRKWLISAFIVLSLTTQVLQNMAVGYIGPLIDNAHPLGPAARLLDNVRWTFETYGFYTSTNTYWRMFSPVHKYDWDYHVIAVDEGGSERELTAPSSRATDPASATVAFREAKLLLNLWTRPPMQQAYLDHRCREEIRAGRDPDALRLEMWWRNIVPPEQAAATGNHRSQELTKSVMATRSCP